MAVGGAGSANETRGWEQEAQQWAAFLALELLPSADVAALLEVRPPLLRRRRQTITSSAGVGVSNSVMSNGFLFDFFLQVRKKGS